MNIAVTSSGRRGALIGILALALLAFSLLALERPASSRADFSDNTTCRGHVAKGDPDPDDPTAVGVKYVFGCSGPITGYSIITPPHQIQGLETEVFVTDKAGAVVSTDSFSCNGGIPGWGVNCVGTYGGGGRIVPGQFFIGTPLCKEGRLDPLLVVTYATYAKNPNGTPKLTNGAPTVTTAVAGPFDLGRPHGCPRPKRGHPKAKIPQERDTDASLARAHMRAKTRAKARAHR